MDSYPYAFDLAMLGKHAELAAWLTAHPNIHGLERYRIIPRVWNFSLLEAAALNLHYKCVRVVVDHFLERIPHTRSNCRMRDCRMWGPYYAINIAIEAKNDKTEEWDYIKDAYVSDREDSDENVALTVREIIRIFSSNRFETTLWNILRRAVTGRRPSTFILLAEDPHIIVKWETTDSDGMTLLGHAIEEEFRINSPDAPITTWILNNIDAFASFALPATTRQDVREWFERVVLPRVNIVRAAPMAGPAMGNINHDQPVRDAESANNPVPVPIIEPSPEPALAAPSSGKRSAPDSDEDVDSDGEEEYISADEEVVAGPLKKRCLRVFERAMRDVEQVIGADIDAAKASAQREIDGMRAAARQEADRMHTTAINRANRIRDISMAAAQREVETMLTDAREASGAMRAAAKAAAQAEVTEMRAAAQTQVNAMLAAAHAEANEIRADAKTKAIADVCAMLQGMNGSA